MNTSFSERVIMFLLNPGQRFRGLIVLAYATAFTGLSISLFPGSSMTGGWFSIGLVLMAFAFFLLFYLSVTVIESR